MAAKNIVITGCNRGIGYHLCRQLSQTKPTVTVIATTRCKQKSPDLMRLSSLNGNVRVLELDTTHYSRYDKFLDECHRLVGNRGISVLVNNAGVMSGNGLMSVTADDLNHDFNVNAIGPLMLTRKLLPLLETSARDGHPTSVVNISSTLGTMTAKVEPNKQYYPYRISKAALNMKTKVLAFDLNNNNIRVVAVHPGWVKTDMGSKSALLEPEFAAQCIAKVIVNIDNSMNGKLINYDGKVLQLLTN